MRWKLLIDNALQATETRAMFHVQFDESNQLLSIRFSQHVAEEEAKTCLKEIRSLLEGRQGPFRLLTDLSVLESMDLACRPYVDSTMELCNQHGIKTVVRVIPDPQKGMG